MKDPDNAVIQVQWALQEAYKMAVRLRGINHWGEDFKTIEAKEKATREVEDYQLRIAKLILQEGASQ